MGFEAEFSRKDCKAKWFFKKDELFPGPRNKFTAEGVKHSFVLTKPCVEDSGKYSVECLGVATTCLLTVLEADPDYKFVKPLPKKSPGYTTKNIELEAVVNSHKAIVHWYKGDTKIEDDEKYETYKDMT